MVESVPEKTGPESVEEKAIVAMEEKKEDEGESSGEELTFEQYLLYSARFGEIEGL